MTTNRKKESMEQESAVIETSNTGNADLSDAQSRAIKHWESANQSYKNTIEDIWNCGRALCEVNEKLKRQGWGKWLESADIPTSTAYRWMEFSKGYEFSKIGEVSMTKGLKALQLAREKLKEAAKEDEPDEETVGEASSVQQEEVTDGDGTLQVPVEIEFPQQIQQLSEKLQATEEKLRKAEEEVAELRETKKEVERLQEENERLRGLLEENGISLESKKEYQPAA